ncbi:nSTAND1 domain-containing NTPase [Cobetia amphilecti]|uniref:nSTAND1 domain-containing NTPase n=1 Tax=Cobetia amphilecti TaxID=1055104 RepID=UPI0026E3B9F9|nr:hypothetical protein [Cobetia amphilecti]MDO6815338.1 hypothetical protein [Cobetia amphilecti]
MKKLTRRDVINAFQPAKEITNPKRFAGRRKQFNRALEALLADGAHICIYGQRGIGKSSFSRQIADVASGETEILDALNLSEFKDEKFNFITLRIACEDSVVDLEHLIQRSLTSSEGFAKWTKSEISKKIIQDARDFSLVPGGIGAKTHHHEVTEVIPTKLSLIESFIEVVKDAQKQSSDGILFLIDEFDRIKDPSGLASLLKALAGVNLKVMLVGVADNLKDLVAEHESLQRQMSEGAIPLPPMEDSEVIEILNKAVNSLDNRISISEDVKIKIAQLCKGQPYLAHLFGKYSLLDAFRSGTSEVNINHLDNALSSIATEGHEVQLEERYRRAVASSAQRETVLRAFAAINRDKIHNSEAYELCPNIDQPGVYLGHLRQDKYGAELIDRENRYHEFKDALFKAYINATPRRFNSSS